MQQNLVGHAQLLTAKALGKRHPHPRDMRDIRNLEVVGATTLENLYEPELIDELSRATATWFESDESRTGNAELDTYYRRIPDVAKNIPRVIDVVNPRVCRLISGYYRRDFRITNITCWRNYHVPPAVSSERELFSYRWHCDTGNVSKLTLFVMLTDTSNNHGPTHSLTKQRTRYLIRTGYRNRNRYHHSSQEMEEPPHVSKATGARGTALLLNATQCLHRASIPRAGNHRDMLSVGIEPILRRRTPS